jgi:hypothetical protein
MSYVFSISRVSDTFTNAESADYGTNRFNTDNYKNLIEHVCKQIENDRTVFWETGKIPNKPTYGYFIEDLSCFEVTCVNFATCMAHVKMQRDKKIYLVPLCNSCNKKNQNFKLKKNVPLAFENLDGNLHLKDKKAKLYFQYKHGSFPLPIDLSAV